MFTIKIFQLFAIIFFYKISELESHEIVPARYDWKGQRHQKTFKDMEDEFGEPANEYLLNKCFELCTRLNPGLNFWKKILRNFEINGFSYILFFQGPPMSGPYSKRRVRLLPKRLIFFKDWQIFRLVSPTIPINLNGILNWPKTWNCYEELLDIYHRSTV